MIRKVGRRYRLVSKKKGKKGKRRNLGIFSSRAAAVRREKQVNYFKYLGKRKRR